MTTDFNELVPNPEGLTEVFEGGTWFEGPCWVPSKGVLRWSDVIENCIWEHDPATTETVKYREGVDHTNGRTVDIDGSVLQCSHGKRRVERDRDGEIDVLVDRYLGHRLNAPNDIVVRSDGTVFFTDPSYGMIVEPEGHPGRREYGDHYVFAYTTDGRLRPAVIDMVDPNGLAFSPDESLLYVADSAALTHGGRFGRHHVRVYEVDGLRVKNGRDFVDIKEGVPDGLRVDVYGNVWCTQSDNLNRGTNAVIIFSPEGEEIGRIAVPKRIGNVAFGGEDGSVLFMAASDSIYAIQTGTRDARFDREATYSNGNRLWDMATDWAKP